MNRVQGIFLLFVCGAFASISIGCTPQSERYAPAPGLTPATGATIYGSRDEWSVLMPDIRTSISAVDGIPTRHAWDEPLLVDPGERSLQIGLREGNKRGSIAVQVKLEPGASYKVRSSHISMTKASTWIEDQGSGVRLTEPLVVCVVAYAPLLAALVC